jgi:hypothetical protein
VFGLKHDAKLGNHYGPQFIANAKFLLSSFLAKNYGLLFLRLQGDSRDLLSQIAENLFLSSPHRLRRVCFMP